MPAYRTTPLSHGEIRNRFLLPKVLLRHTRKALLSFALLGLEDRGHEGIAYWAGYRQTPVTVFLSVIVPQARHSHQGVFVDEAAVGAVSLAARQQSLSVLAQVHSHPGGDARHSDGDDRLIVMPYEGMLSLVAPNFGRDLHSITDVVVHQFQDGRWVLCTEESVARSMTLFDDFVDLR